MAVEAPEDVERFGRQVAASFPGFDPNAPGFEAYRYGRIARHSMGKGRSVPDPHEYVDTNATPAPEPARMSQVHEEGRRVRIGRVEMRISDEEPARNRPQHPRHGGQRSSGRYRHFDVVAPPRGTWADRMWTGGTMHNSQPRYGDADAEMAPAMWEMPDKSEARLPDRYARSQSRPSGSLASGAWTGKTGREGTYRFRPTSRSARARYRRAR